MSPTTTFLFPIVRSHAAGALIFGQSHCWLYRGSFGVRSVRVSTLTCEIQFGCAYRNVGAGAERRHRGRHARAGAQLKQRQPGDERKGLDRPRAEARLQVSRFAAAPACGRTAPGADRGRTSPAAGPPPGSWRWRFDAGAMVKAATSMSAGTSANTPERTNRGRRRRAAAAASLCSFMRIPLGPSAGSSPDAGPSKRHGTPHATVRYSDRNGRTSVSFERPARKSSRALAGNSINYRRKR
jgi:hypothetical protein